MQLDPILQVPQVAELLKCSRRTVEERTRNGDLPGIKYGESWVYPTQALLAVVNQQALQNVEPVQRRALAAQVRTPPRLP